mgnify:FL=1
MQITVKLQNLKGEKKIFLDDEKRVFTVNGKDKSVDIDKFASHLLRIVSSWEERYENSRIIDGLTYSVEILKDGKTYNFYGKNNFPKNFYQFSALVGEVLDD